MDLTRKIASYRKRLRELGTPITYNPVTITRGDDGGSKNTLGASQVIPARIDEVGLKSYLVQSGLLHAGDYAVAIPGDETIPIGGQVVARGNTCKVVKTSRQNLAIRNMIYLSKIVPDV